MEKYQITKTIRFKLLPIIAEEIEQKVTKLKAPNIDALMDDVKNVHLRGKELLSALKRFFYFDDKQCKFKSTLEIKARWLRLYTPDQYYLKKTFENSYQLKSLTFFDDVFKNWMSVWEQAVSELATIYENHKNCQHRRDSRAGIALLIKKFSMRGCFPFICDLIDCVNDKNSDKDFLVRLVEELSVLLDKCNSEALPFQSSGIIVGKASLNYYTVSKSEKMLQKEYEDVYHELNSIYDITKFKNISGKVLDKWDIANAKIENVYNVLKENKALQKRLLSEYISQGKSLSLIKSELPLFSNITNDVFESYKNLSKEISGLADKKKKLCKKTQQKEIKDLQSKISAQKKKRGALFQHRFNCFKKYCNDYREVAVQYGKLKARKKAIENDKIEANLLRYWAVILDQGGQHSLVLIPKKNAPDAKRYIESIDSKEGKYVIHHLDSLTLRTLNKLCFNAVDIEKGQTIRENSFYQGIKEEFENGKKYCDDRGCFKIQGLYSFKTAEGKFNEEGVVEFFKEVLKSNHTRKTLNLPYDLESNIFQKVHTSLDQFRQDLEKCCYVLHSKIGKDELVDFVRRFEAQIFDITSIDLESKRRKTKLVSEMKKHTQIWLEFWQGASKQNFSTRVNPELSVFWRAPELWVEKKCGKNSDSYNSNKHNRYLSEQYTLALTITENAGTHFKNLAFKDTSKIKEAIQEFNKLLPQPKYCFGIDRGNAELVSLCLVKNEKDFPFEKFPVYRLRDMTHKGDFKDKHGRIRHGEAIKNISYFIDQEDLFEKENLAAIDITAAKLIKNKIVLNGDVLTYLKLKEETAKHKLALLFQSSSINRNSRVYPDADNNNVFKIKTNRNHNPEKNIYFYRSEYEAIKNNNSLENMLNEFLCKMESVEPEIVLLNRVNHLRDAISANIIGILSYLIDLFPESIVALENLTKETIAQHISQSYENIARRFEWALYRKLQSKQLVPPELKESILLREGNDKIDQFGIIHFVEKENTSKDCPNCRKTTQQTEGNKFINKKFVCEYCGFDTSGDRKGKDCLRSPDTVAAYNIARKKLNHKWKPAFKCPI